MGELVARSPARTSASENGRRPTLVIVDVGLRCRCGCSCVACGLQASAIRTFLLDRTEGTQD